MAHRDENGQGSVEWIGLVTLVAAVLLAVLAFGLPGFPGAGVARAIAASIECAIRVSEGCGPTDELAAAYGADMAAMVRDNAPRLIYEPDSTALPVDFRSCRGPVCGNGPSAGAVTESNTGEPAAAFVHVVDCRPAAIEASERRGYDCGDGRAGNLYIQFWLYYEDSSSLRDLPGKIGFHQDDWEGEQVRITPGGVDSRATSHHGYNYDGGPGAGSPTPASPTAPHGGRRPASSTSPEEATPATSTRTTRTRPSAGLRPGPSS